MKVLVCGTGAARDESIVSKILNKLHDDFVVDEVIRGADEMPGSVDAQADHWCRELGIAQCIFEVIWQHDKQNHVWGDSVFRRNVRMLAAGPDLIVSFESDIEEPAPFLSLRLVRVPVLLVDTSGVVHARGRGWSEFVRARFREAIRGASGPKLNEDACAKEIAAR